MHQVDNLPPVDHEWPIQPAGLTIEVDDGEPVPNRRDKRARLKAHRKAVAKLRAKAAQKPPKKPELKLRRADGADVVLPIILTMRGEPGKLDHVTATVEGLPSTICGKGRDHVQALKALDRSVTRWVQKLIVAETQAQAAAAARVIAQAMADEVLEAAPAQPASTAPALEEPPGATNTLALARHALAGGWDGVVPWAAMAGQLCHELRYEATVSERATGGRKWYDVHHDMGQKPTPPPLATVNTWKGVVQAVVKHYDEQRVAYATTSEP